MFNRAIKWTTLRLYIFSTFPACLVTHSTNTLTVSKYKTYYTESQFTSSQIPTDSSFFKKTFYNIVFLFKTNHYFSFSTYRRINLVWLLYRFATQAKMRVVYYANNWIYTTNHKRIAVNYFFFVIISGICGMVLATIIRAEMAYPGVGILAGDSLQYLSIVTAHGVIMVFFMIMPLLFGAFGNFLLPTQLGVHDVAFPRLNSAAFWFLPAGLIMLCQLVCLDRRYQRMNCFNIRELQVLLRGRFFTDLVNDTAHHNFLDKTMVGLRFKTNNLNTINPNMLLSYQYGLNTSAFVNQQSFNSSNSTYSFTTINSLKHTLVTLFNTTGYRDEVVNHVSAYNHTLTTLVQLIGSIKNTLTGMSPYWVKDLTFNTQHLVNFVSVKITPISSISSTVTETTNTDTTLYNSTTWANHSLSTQNELGFSEHNMEQRFQRFTNPVFKINYKVGNYFKKDQHELNLQQISSKIEITTGMRRALWLFSPDFNELFHTLSKVFTDYHWNTCLNLSKAPRWMESPKLVHLIHSPYGFFNFFFTLSSDTGFMNRRWVSVNAIDQKYYKMFTSASMQQQVYGNWRQLKFTREAWRCKLLAARHQKSLYRRYENESKLLWIVERNAKDLLPGWAMVTPFSSRTKYTLIGKVDIGLMGVFLVLNSSIVSSANFLVTYRYLSSLNNRKMRDARSFFAEGVMVASWMMITANPMLAIGIIMLLCDRHWRTSFFDYSGGGDTVLFQHMFWFFGHPEVYVIMIPVFGFTNTLLSYYLRKRVSARASLMYSMYTIAFLGFFVWGHHMYMVGLAHTTRMLFSTLTVMISIPAATKLMHWCVTIANSSFIVELPFLFVLLFMAMFISGGISGMAVAHTGMDILFHDTFYVIGHFHVMFAGAAMFGSFGAFYFYFPAIFGVKFSRIWGYIHLVYYTLGQLITVIPMFWLGFSGMPRRVLDYPSALGGWHGLVSAGHMLSVAGLIAFFIMMFDSLRRGKAATRTNFGISRFNTRFNFYLYEVARTFRIERKGWQHSRFIRSKQLGYKFKESKYSNTPVNFLNHEYLETVQYSYVFTTESKKQ